MVRKIGQLALQQDVEKMMFTGTHPGGDYSVYAPLTPHGPLPDGWRWYNVSQNIILLPVGSYLIHIFVDGAEQMRITHFRRTAGNVEYEVVSGGETLQQRTATISIMNESTDHGLLLRGPSVAEGRRIILTVIRIV